MCLVVFNHSSSDIYMISITKVSWSVILTFFLFQNVNNICGQSISKGSLTGIVAQAGTQTPIPFVHIALYNSTDSLMLGVRSSDDGKFRINGLSIGKYVLNFTSVAYQEKTIGITMLLENAVDLDTVLLTAAQTELKEVIIRGERINVQSEADKTVFLINRKMLDNSSNGVDLLKLLPGISVDLMQNISVDGNPNVIILVNGMERDGKYLSQLRAADIERVEKMTSPPARYEGAAARVINIILKSGKGRGFSGNINFEAPTSKTQIYAFPSARLSYGRDKIDAFVSYSGSFAYFNIFEKTCRKIFSQDSDTEIFSFRQVRQKNWSHRFNYGVDFSPNKRNNLTLYGYYNPYSQEHDGHAEMNCRGRIMQVWKTRKEDYDRNHANFYSLFYKRILGKTKGHEFTIDASLYRLLAKNETVFTNNMTGGLQMNLMKPGQNSLNIRADYALPIKTIIKITTGFQTKFHRFVDRNSEGFKYVSASQAVYGGFRFSKSKLVAETSLRLERAMLNLVNVKSDTYYTFLPNIVFQYQLKENASLKANLQKSLEYPGLYQINPNIMMDDPLTTRSGNSSLKPVHITNAGIEYNRTFGKNWVAIRTLYSRKSQVISGLSRLSDSGIFHTQLFNLGALQQYGGQLTGSFSIGNVLTFQSYFKIFQAFSKGNNFAIAKGLQDQHKTVYETAVSVHASLPKGLAISAQFSYNSPMIEVQKTVFCDPLYFISLHKTFAKVIKTGLTFAFPLGRNFNYQGDAMSAPAFVNYSRRVIHLSMFPIIAKVSFTFNKGIKREQQQITKEDLYVKPGKGF